MSKLLNRNVLHIVDHMGLGGAQRIIQGLIVAGYGKAIFSLRKKGKLIGPIPEEIPVFYGKKSLFGIIFSIRDIYKIIKEYDINYIHCHLPFSAIVGFVLSYLNPSSTIVFHDHGDLAGGNWIYRLVLFNVAKRGKVIVNSVHQKRLGQKLGLKKELVLIYNFVNPDEFYKDVKGGEDFRKKLNLGENKFCVGFASRLISSKGWADLLIAFKNLSSENIVLIIAGDGKDFHQIEKFIQNHQIPNTLLLGQITEMRVFYNALDVFVMPTKKEAFGLSQIESQACGVPIIAYNTKGLNETVDQSNSLLVDVGSIKELQRAIESIITNRELKDKLSKAGIINASKFTSKNYMDKLIKNV